MGLSWVITPPSLSATYVAINKDLEKPTTIAVIDEDEDLL